MAEISSSAAPLNSLLDYSDPELVERRIDPEIERWIQNQEVSRYLQVLDIPASVRSEDEARMLSCRVAALCNGGLQAGEEFAYLLFPADQFVLRKNLRNPSSESYRIKIEDDQSDNLNSIAAELKKVVAHYLWPAPDLWVNTVRDRGKAWVYIRIGAEQRLPIFFIERGSDSEKWELQVCVQQPNSATWNLTRASGDNCGYLFNYHLKSASDLTRTLTTRNFRYTVTWQRFLLRLLTALCCT